MVHYSFITTGEIDTFYGILLPHFYHKYMLEHWRILSLAVPPALSHYIDLGRPFAEIIATKGQEQNVTVDSVRIADAILAAHFRIILVSFPGPTAYIYPRLRTHLDKRSCRQNYDGRSLSLHLSVCFTSCLWI